MKDKDYKNAYERQKLARKQAEELLETRSAELYEANQSLLEAFNKLKDQKAQILHQEKLASIGQLSAGVAHEINNPLAYIKSNLNSLESYVGDISAIFSIYEETIQKISKNNENREEYIASLDAVKKERDLAFILQDIVDLVGDCVDGANKVHEIVKGLKSFSRRDEEDEPVCVDVNQCLENTIKLIWNEIKYKANLEKDLGDIPCVMGRPGNLSQVFLNLIVNASHAIEESGTIAIKSSVIGKAVVIEIADNGSGMDSDTMTKIFDPFFTTKKQGEGTGLGLSISHGIIKKHGGEILVDSVQGEGTVFSIYLPVP